MAPVGAVSTLKKYIASLNSFNPKIKRLMQSQERIMDPKCPSYLIKHV